MNTISFAIASIVDANTGYTRHHTRGNVGYADAVPRANKFRFRSLLTSWGGLRNSIAAFVERYRKRAEQRRQLAELASLSDRLLRDIGLHRGDIHAVESGQVSLADLHRDRRQRSSRNLRSLATRPLALPRASSNDDALDKTRCA